MSPMSPLCRQQGHQRVTRGGYVYCSRLGCTYNNTPLEKAAGGGRK